MYKLLLSIPPSLKYLSTDIFSPKCRSECILNIEIGQIYVDTSTEFLCKINTV